MFRDSLYLEDNCCRAKLRNQRVEFRTIVGMTRITVSPTIHFGKPCFAGTRITVESVIELMQDGVPFTRIIEDFYPDLRPEDFFALIEWIETAEYIQAFQDSQMQLDAAGGDPEKAGWLRWENGRDETE